MASPGDENNKETRTPGLRIHQAKDKQNQTGGPPRTERPAKNTEGLTSMQTALKTDLLD
jgi:hypothetical protein